MACLPGTRAAKLDAHTAAGIFLGYTPTEKNIYYQDINTLCIKSATHVTFDEANYTVPKVLISPAMALLQELGYYQQAGQQEIALDAPQVTNAATDQTHFQIQLLSINGNTPTKATDGSAGYDI
jgi:hypothetical protein